MSQTADNALLDRVMFEDVLDGAYVDARRLQQFLADGAAQFGYVIRRVQTGMLEDDLTRQAIAVGVQPRAGQPQDQVADLDALAGDDVFALDNADAEARHVIVA